MSDRDNAGGNAQSGDGERPTTIVEGAVVHIQTIKKIAFRSILSALFVGVLVNLVSFSVYYALISNTLQPLENAISSRVDDQIRRIDKQTDRLDAALSDLTSVKNDMAILVVELKDERVQFEDSVNTQLDQLNLSVSAVFADLHSIAGILEQRTATAHPIAIVPPVSSEQIDDFAIGGEGQVPVPNFPSYTKALRFNISDEDYRREEKIVADTLRRSLTRGVFPRFDPEKHDIEVFGSIREDDRGRQSLQMIGVVVYRESSESSLQRP